MAQFLICRLPTLKFSMKKALKMLLVTLMMIINPRQLIQVEFLKSNILLTCFQAMVNMSKFRLKMARNTIV